VTGPVGRADARENIPSEVMQMPKARRMTSKAQWRFLYARHKKFAHKWAERVERSGGVKTGYRALPARTGTRKRV
jgi:hypothetical protein